MTEIELQFHNEMLEIYFKIKREVNYFARRFLAMVKRRGGLDAAKCLILKKTPSQGLKTIGNANKPELTVEYLVLKPEYHGLFTEQERQLCREKLAGLASLEEK